jgi:hypothetical protein
MRTPAPCINQAQQMRPPTLAVTLARVLSAGSTQKVLAASKPKVRPNEALPRLDCFGSGMSDESFSSVRQHMLLIASGYRLPVLYLLVCRLCVCLLLGRHFFS